jgi:ubiquinone/menaquinone biosynthesis C-methylase UbiE
MTLTERTDALPERPDEIFASTAPYYARFRPGYPPEVFTELVRRFAIDRTSRVLDLGCGPGHLTFGLAASAGAVVAVDPSPEMLEEGRRIAAERRIDNIDWRIGDSTGLASYGADQFHLVTMGASFHWMDRDATLAQLDRMVVAGGGVVVASGGHEASPEPAWWHETIREVRTAWLGPERRAGSGTYQHPPERHEVVLARSPFSEVATLAFHWRLERSLEELIGAQFSYSYSAPALFGDRKDEFADELRSRLRDAGHDGVVCEMMVTEVLIGTRPGEAATRR